MNGMSAKVDDDVGNWLNSFLLNRTCDVVFVKFYISCTSIIEVTQKFMLLLKADKK